MWSKNPAVIMAEQNSSETIYWAPTCLRCLEELTSITPFRPKDADYYVVVCRSCKMGHYPRAELWDQVASSNSFALQNGKQDTEG